MLWIKTTLGFALVAAALGAPPSGNAPLAAHTSVMPDEDALVNLAQDHDGKATESVAESAQLRCMSNCGKGWYEKMVGKVFTCQMRHGCSGCDMCTVYLKEKYCKANTEQVDQLKKLVGTLSKTLTERNAKIKKLEKKTCYFDDIFAQYNQKKCKEVKDYAEKRNQDAYDCQYQYKCDKDTNDCDGRGKSCLELQRKNTRELKYKRAIVNGQTKAMLYSAIKTVAAKCDDTFDGSGARLCTGCADPTDDFYKRRQLEIWRDLQSSRCGSCPKGDCNSCPAGGGDDDDDDDQGGAQED